MRTNQVVPDRHERESCGVYKVESSQQLPEISAKKTIKSVWMSPQTLKKFNRAMHHCRGLIMMSLLIAGPLCNSSFLYPAPIGRWIARVAGPLAMFAIINAMLSLRYDMVMLVIGTYDFWYRSVGFSVGSVAFAFYVRDVRAFTAVTFVCAYNTLLLMDANFRAMKMQVGMSILGAVILTLGALWVSFSWVDGNHDYSVFRVYDITVTARSIIANAYVVSAIFSLHNAYVRWTFAKASTSQSLTTTARCVLYRQRLRWHESSAELRHSVETRHSKRAFQQDTIQLRCPGLLLVINARNTLLKSSHDSPLTPYPWLLQRALLTCGVVGFVSMSATFAVVANGQDLSSNVVRGLSILSITTTAPVNAFFLCCMYQVEMLWLLYTSFDFAFNFGQVVLAHVALYDLCDYDVRVHAVTASLLWMHWACVIDAIPPIKRAQLGALRNVRRAAMVVQIAFFVALVLFSIDLIAWHSQRFVNDELLHGYSFRPLNSTASGDANSTVGSFFLNRAAIILLWLGRSMYRNATYDDDELVALRGRVEFDDYDALSRQQRSLSTLVKINAIVQALSEQSKRSENAGPEVDTIQEGTHPIVAENGR